MIRFSIVMPAFQYIFGMVNQGGNHKVMILMDFLNAAFIYYRINSCLSFKLLALNIVWVSIFNFKEVSSAAAFILRCKLLWG